MRSRRRAPERAIVAATIERRAGVLVVGMRRPVGRRARCAYRVVAATRGNVMVVPLGRPRRPVRPGARR